MTEPTDEMIREFWAAAEWPTKGSLDLRRGLAAVLAIVERDRTAAAKREWDALRPCPSPDPDGIWICERELGHSGPHHALRWYREWP